MKLALELDTHVIIPDAALQAYPDAVALRIHGDSMEPTLHDGDAVWLDVSARTPNVGDVVAVYANKRGIGRGSVVGRFDRAPGNITILSKDNHAKYSPIRLGRTAGFAVLGTVRYIVARYHERSLLEMVMVRDVTPGITNRVTLSDPEIRARLQRASEWHHATVTALRGTRRKSIFA